MAGPIWLVSYPKSGNTWLRLLLSNLLSGRQEPEDINNLCLTMRSLVHKAEIEEQTLVDTHLLTRQECDRFRPALMAQVWREADGSDVFIKLHDAYRRLNTGMPVLGPAARAAIYIMRDPRDVAVSLAFHNGQTIERGVSQILSAKTRMGGENPQQAQISQPLLDWSGHVRSWTGQRDVPILVLRYEDLQAETAAVFGRAITFLGLPAAPHQIEQAVRHADFSLVQRQEADRGFNERQANSTAPFFRNGQVGGWRQALSPEQAAAIEAAHGAVMAEFGYL